MGGALKAGRQIGRFVLERKLGTGGTGVVYLAHDQLLNIKVALKLLNPSRAKGGAFARFSREVLLARRLSHPGICRLFDIHEVEDFLFITMEYVEGPTLESLITEQGILPTNQTAEIIAAICRALSTAHRLGIVHRDLKPSNIIVRPGNRVSILDFGLAKALDMASITASGTLIGTIYYMSPEVIAGKPATAQSDIYSTGVILYRCATGRFPFEGNDVVDIKNAIESGESIPPSQFNSDVSLKLENVINRAMMPAPGKRFASVDEFKETLADAVIGLSDVYETTEQTTRPWDRDLEKSIQEAVGDPSYSEMLQTHRHEATVLFSDIVAITPYFDKHGDVAGRKKIKAHNEMVFPAIKRCRGKVVKTMGDAIMACFEDADDAVEAAIEMQIILDKYNACTSDIDERTCIRIGLHSGGSVFKNRDVFGNTVNIAAQICSKTEGGEILASSATRELLDRTRHVALYHSATSLKGKPDIYNLYSISWDSLADMATIEESLADLGSASDSGQDSGDPETDTDVVDDELGAVSTHPGESERKGSSLPRQPKLVRNVLIAALACIAVTVVAGMGISLSQKTSIPPEVSEPKIQEFDPTISPITSNSPLTADPEFTPFPQTADERPPSQDEWTQPPAGPEPALITLRKLKSSLKRTARKKGILAGDSPKFDAARRKMNALWRQSKYESAISAGWRAESILEKIRINKSFVNSKLKRFYEFFERTDDDSAAGAIIDLREAIIAAIDSGQYRRANRLINQAFQVVRSK